MYFNRFALISGERQLGALLQPGAGGRPRPGHGAERRARLLAARRAERGAERGPVPRGGGERLAAGGPRAPGPRAPRRPRAQAQGAGPRRQLGRQLRGRGRARARPQRPRAHRPLDGGRRRRDRRAAGSI